MTARIMRMLLKCFLLIVLIIGIAPLWGEIFTRILLPQSVDSQMNIHQSDSIAGFIYKPNARAYEKGREYNVLYQINSIGLRDREYGIKNKGTFRILLLGDSFAVSHGLAIDDSLSRQLESSIQSYLDQDGIEIRIEIINAACGGYSPYNYWKAYWRWAPILDPDAVIVALSPDDYDSSNAHMHYVVENGEVISISREANSAAINNISYSKKLIKWLSHTSEFYILLRNYFYYNDVAGKISIWIEQNNQATDTQLQQFIAPQTERIKASWMQSFSYLMNLRRECMRDHLPLIVVSMPLKLEVDYAQLQKTMEAKGLKAYEFNVTQPLKQISSFCRKENLLLIDPRDEIRKQHKRTPCYFVYDGHLTKEGIRTAARAIAIQWRKLRLSPW